MPLQNKPDEGLIYGPVTVNELFCGLSAAGRNTLASFEERRSVAANVTVFAAGDLPLFLYVHLSGSAVLIPASGPERVTYACPIGSNGIYGLVEALSGNTFESTFKTITACEFCVIGKDRFLGFIRQRPATCFRLAEILSRSYRQALQTIRSQ